MYFKCTPPLFTWFQQVCLTDKISQILLLVCFNNCNSEISAVATFPKLLRWPTAAAYVNIAVYTSPRSNWPYTADFFRIFCFQDAATAFSRWFWNYFWKTFLGLWTVVLIAWNFSNTLRVMLLKWFQLLPFVRMQV